MEWNRKGIENKMKEIENKTKLKMKMMKENQVTQTEDRNVKVNQDSLK